MAYLAAMRGAVGLQFFIHRFKYGPPQAWAAALEAGRELVELSPAMLGESACASASTFEANSVTA